MAEAIMDKVVDQLLNEAAEVVLTTTTTTTKPFCPKHVGVG